MAGMDPMELINNVRNEIKTGKKECQTEVLALFKKMFTAIDIHTDTASFNKGLDDLTTEMYGLKDKLAAVTMERNNLLDTVENMKVEMKQLSAKIMPTIQENGARMMMNMTTKSSPA